MINTIENLRNALEKDTIISKEVTDALLQLDTTASTATQADLNDMLVALYERIKTSTDKIKFEAMPRIVITTDVLSNWVNSEFTTYSANLFNKTIKENKGNNDKNDTKELNNKLVAIIMILAIIAIALTVWFFEKQYGVQPLTEEYYEETIEDLEDTTEALNTETETEEITNEVETDANEVEISTTEKVEETEYHGTLDTVEFIVDTTEVYKNNETQLTNVIGDTATLDNYSGVINIQVSDAVEDASGLELKADKHYVFTVEPMMTRSVPPIANAVSIRDATDDDLNKLENIREEVSNYAECMLRYEDMEEQEILNDYIYNIGRWTDDEVQDFYKYLEEHGYGRNDRKYNTQESETDESVGVTNDTEDVSLAPLTNNPAGRLFYSE